MGFEIKTGSMKERLRSIEEIGTVMGLNGVVIPVDIKSVIGKALYGTEDRTATDRYFVARFRETWYMGAQQRIKDNGGVVSIEETKKMKECFDDMKFINEAFRLGEDFRYNGKSAVWIADDKLFELMDGKSEDFGQLCVDSWIAGWRFMDEEISLGAVQGKPKKVLYRVNADKLSDFIQYRENESGPEADDEEGNKYYDIYCHAVERLRHRGEDDLVDCITCPYMYRGLGVTIDENGKADWCDADCAYVSGIVNDCCGNDISLL